MNYVILILDETLRELNSDYEYNVYISAPGLNYPTYSSLITLPFLTLQKRSTVFVRFAAFNYIKIRKRGLLDDKIYCKENSNVSDTVICAKGCFLKTFNVRSIIFFMNATRMYVLLR